MLQPRGKLREGSPKPSRSVSYFARSRMTQRTTFGPPNSYAAAMPGPRAFAPSFYGLMARASAAWSACRASWKKVCFLFLDRHASQRRKGRPSSDRSTQLGKSNRSDRKLERRIEPPRTVLAV